MLKNDIVGFSSPPAPTKHTLTMRQRIGIGLIFLFTIIFILSILVSVAPLRRQADAPLLSSLSTNNFLEMWGTWLPSDLHLTQDYAASQLSTSNIEFILLMAVAFVVYGLSALFVRLQPKETKQTQTRLLILAGTLVAGLIFVLTPAMLSHDALVYADYGRTIIAHGSNPYFTSPAIASHRDPITRLDDWSAFTAAYGPLWLYICSLWAMLLGDDPVKYILAYRLMGFVAHLVNTLLVAIILRRTGASQRTVTLGTLLYAYNPLALLESCLGGHNDVFMVTLMLLGALLSIRAEQKTFIQPKYYIPPVIIFTLATLVKFTAIPIVFFFLILLARRTLLAHKPDALSSRQMIVFHWSTALPNLFLASLVYALVSLVFYIPFWIGHSISAIVHSFSTPPSSYYAENSFLRVAIEWMKVHRFSNTHSWVHKLVSLLSLHATWSIIDSIALACVCLAGAVLLWRLPTTLTMILSTLAVLEILLVVTPWFYQWYVLWLIGLAAVLLAQSNTWEGRAVIATALTFSVTAFCSYFANIYVLKFDGVGLQSFATLIPPAIVLLVLLCMRKPRLRLKQVP